MLNQLAHEERAGQWTDDQEKDLLVLRTKNRTTLAGRRLCLRLLLAKEYRTLARTSANSEGLYLKREERWLCNRRRGRGFFYSGAYSLGKRKSLVLEAGTYGIVLDRREWNSFGEGATTGG
ncbi:hypothetical protein TNCV_2037721 [Trichonephila clavipes]|nr:hypothetical protein TNCV_2037721 [Trichonephila clavipes]